jgi:hypothetical protein
LLEPLSTAEKLYIVARECVGNPNRKKITVTKKYGWQKTEDDNKKEQHENINRKSFCEKKANKK